MKRRLGFLLTLSFLATFAITGCGGHAESIVAPDESVSQTEVPGGAMSDEEYAKEMEKSMSN